MSERWLPVVDLEGVYEVSDHGRVRSLDRVLFASSRAGRKYRRRLRGRILRPAAGERGYLRLTLWFRHQKRQATVHELVLSAFVGPRPFGHYGCHRDGRPQNNQLANLYWGTPTENVADARRHGTLRTGERIPWSKLCAADVIEIRAVAGTVSQSKLATRFGVAQCHISRIVNQKEWKDAA